MFEKHFLRVVSLPESKGKDWFIGPSEVNETN